MLTNHTSYDPEEILLPAESTGKVFFSDGGDQWIALAHHAGGAWKLQYRSPYLGPRGAVLENDADTEYIYLKQAAAAAPATPTGGAGVAGFIPDGGWVDVAPDPTVDEPYVFRSVRQQTGGAWQDDDFAAPAEFSRYVETWVDLSIEFTDNGAKYWKASSAFAYRITGGTPGARAWIADCNFRASL